MRQNDRVKRPGKVDSMCYGSTSSTCVFGVMQQGKYANIAFRYWENETILRFLDKDFVLIYAFCITRECWFQADSVPRGHGIKCKLIGNTRGDFSPFWNKFFVLDEGVKCHFLVEQNHWKYFWNDEKNHRKLNVGISGVFSQFQVIFKQIRS